MEMTYLEKIQRLYNVPENGYHGIPEVEITALEQRLNIKLPAVLRHYYLTLGDNESINKSHNQLLNLNKVDLTDDGYFIFYEENQAVVQWGIKEEDLIVENPPVWGNYDTIQESDWQKETKSTEDFLLLMAVYNGTLGGLVYNANSFSPVPSDAIALIQREWTEIPEISWEKQKIYTDEYFAVISLSFGEDHQCDAIFIGTSQEDRFEKILDIPGIDWSYTSYEDMDDDDGED